MYICDDKRRYLFNVILQTIIFLIIGCRSSNNSYLYIPANIVEQVIDYKDIQQFFHPEIKGRIPLLISNNLVDPNISLTKFGEKVKILPESEIKQDAFIKFDSFEVSGNSAVVKILYGIEGISAEFKFEKVSKEKWNLKQAKIYER